MTSIKVFAITSKCGDFHLTMSSRWSGNHHYTEGDSNRHRPLLAKDSNHIFRQGVGGNVVIFGVLTKELITNTAACPKRLKTGGTQLSDDIEGKFTAWICGGVAGVGHSADLSCRW
jgi:hypothetical protein